MKVGRVVMLSDTHAVVHLRASWLARLFGAKDLLCELVYEHPRWITKYTREPLNNVQHARLLRHALEFHPLEWHKDIDGIPVAFLREEQE